MIALRVFEGHELCSEACRYFLNVLLMGAVNCCVYRAVVIR